MSSRVHSAKQLTPADSSCYSAASCLKCASPTLEEAFVDPLPPHLGIVGGTIGSRWVASDMAGSKLNLLVHEHFVSDSETGDGSTPAC